ncbi:MAG: hypothetical protein ACI9QN_002718, partial [Arcticibacterium sp.]
NFYPDLTSRSSVNFGFLVALSELEYLSQTHE